MSPESTIGPTLADHAATTAINHAHRPPVHNSVDDCRRVCPGHAISAAVHHSCGASRESRTHPRAMLEFGRSVAQSRS